MRVCVYGVYVCMYVCCVCACVCVCVCLRVCAVTHLPLHMHISGDGGVVLVGLEQEPHRVQDWSELPVVRYMQPHLIHACFISMYNACDLELTYPNLHMSMANLL